MSVRLKIGGVPEHFNLPWHLCMEEGLFEKIGVEVEWKDYPGGTGAMTRDLRHNSVDLAVVLTEGMVADIALGNHSSIMGFYTKTPLTWGVHTTAFNRFEVFKDVDPAIFAISRWGSGSHLMAYVYAEKNGLQPKRDISFKVVGNLDKARESLGEKSSNLFLWEKFTTKPYCDSGELKRIDEIPTPWPCFVVAGRNAIIAKHETLIWEMLNILKARIDQLKNDTTTITLIAERYKLLEEDVEKWFGATEWDLEKRSVQIEIEKVIDKLKSIDVISDSVSKESLLRKALIY